MDSTLNSIWTGQKPYSGIDTIFLWLWFSAYRARLLSGPKSTVSESILSMISAEFADVQRASAWAFASARVLMYRTTLELGCLSL